MPGKVKSSTFLSKAVEDHQVTIIEVLRVCDFLDSSFLWPQYLYTVQNILQHLCTGSKISVCPLFILIYSLYSLELYLYGLDLVSIVQCRTLSLLYSTVSTVLTLFVRSLLYQNTITCIVPVLKYCTRSIYLDTAVSIYVVFYQLSAVYI